MQKYLTGIWPFLLFGFLVLSWPFINYPLTDGDIMNWADAAREVRNTNVFFKGMNDQGHGPLLAWTAGVLTKLSPTSFYLLNFFNLLCGLTGIVLAWFFSKKLWDDVAVSRLVTFLFSTTLATVYLSRTPMYDWPATIGYFAFFGFYLLYLKTHHARYLGVALLAIGIGSLSRFSICWGLAGFVLIGSWIVYRRGFWVVVRDGCLITGVVALFNLPWLWGQIQMHGADFLQTFVYDNTGRFVKSTRPDAVFRKDFYGFTIYVLIGMLPHTFLLIGSFFKRSFFARMKGRLDLQMITISFLPCLIFFSLSGHTKLARYIAYVFPGIIMLLGYYLAKYDLKEPEFRRKCAQWMGWTAVGIMAVFALLIFQFPGEVQQSPLLAVGIIGLISGLIGLNWVLVKKFPRLYLEEAHRALVPFGVFYVLFFSILAVEATHVKFLLEVRDAILQQLM